MHCYRICGLAVVSEIELPGLLDFAPGAAVPDVTVRHGSVPPGLEHALASGPTWELGDDCFLLRIPGIARFLLRGGRSITVAAEPGGDAADIPVFILGTVLGILLHQRGQIVLHASAIEVNGRAVLFCGPSGAGKSTLAAALAQRGYPFVVDDVCVVTITGSGPPVVHPDGRRVKLWAHAIERLDLERQRGERVRNRLEKFYVDPSGPVARPLALGAVYALREARPPHRPGIERPNAVDAALLLRRNAYRPLLVRRMGQRGAYFHAATAIANSAGIFHLTRALDFAQMPELIAWLERHWIEIGLAARAA